MIVAALLLLYNVSTTDSKEETASTIRSCSVVGGKGTKIEFIFSWFILGWAVPVTYGAREIALTNVAIYCNNSPSEASTTWAWLFTQYLPVAIKAIGVLLFKRLAPSSPISNKSLSKRLYQLLMRTNNMMWIWMN